MKEKSNLVSNSVYRYIVSQYDKIRCQQTRKENTQNLYPNSIR